MVKKKGDNVFTVIQLPSLYPTSEIISQLTSPKRDGTVWLDIAPQSPCQNFKQIDVFEHCAVNNIPLYRAIPDNTHTIIINNLSFWVLYCGVSRVYRELLQLSRDYKVISTITRDTLDQEIEDTILLLPDTIISLSQDSEDQLTGTYTETVRQSSGRTEKKTQRYILTGSASSFKLDISKVEEKPSPVTETSTCDVTFELGLSEREKSARAATELPYTVTNPPGSNSDTTGHIHYVPDDMDDWDDEDPDDDLDI